MRPRCGRPTGRIFALRRTYGPRAGLQAARLDAMVGFAGTSDVQDARKRFREDLADLPDSARRIENPEPVRPVRSESLDHLTASVQADIEARLCPEDRTAPSDTADRRSATLSVPPDTDRTRDGGGFDGPPTGTIGPWQADTTVAFHGSGGGIPPRHRREEATSDVRSRTSNEER
ncbi:hypothetical protein GCM10010260_40760 [Streptomyces filipinensis]|uniref:Uncharacterized protein n=1 Tax=Streptomyces filipinensis TaxID=66887 RepID=A0A918MCE1_9ACTN|nr:hypothetical protein GCM10010260_40760 [Streptomyces filipinensis]